MEESCVLGELSFPLSSRSAWPDRCWLAQQHPWPLGMRPVPTWWQLAHRARIITIELTNAGPDTPAILIHGGSTARLLAGGGQFVTSGVAGRGPCPYKSGPGQPVVMDPVPGRAPVMAWRRPVIGRRKRLHSRPDAGRSGIERRSRPDPCPGQQPETRWTATSRQLRS
jgi:hypothetical protein